MTKEYQFGQNLAGMLGLDRTSLVPKYFTEPTKLPYGLGEILGPNRMMSSFDLADKLRRFERAGVEIPRLKFSQLMPNYVGSDGSGNELYCIGSSIIQVPVGSVIDSHGNVVDLSRLEKEEFLARFAKEIQPIGKPKHQEVYVRDLTDIRRELNRSSSKPSDVCRELNLAEPRTGVERKTHDWMRV